MDESFDISDSLYGPLTTGPWRDTEIGVLQAGFWPDTIALLRTFGREGIPIPRENFSPSLAGQYKVILVPSGGLQSLSSLDEMQDKFAEYLEAGGNLLILAQPTADDYSIIPGPVSSLGYVEDTACYSQTGAIVRYLPCFAGQRDTTVDGNADGVLTQWPENAEVWLRRIKNGYPALISYAYGQGRVVISTYYTDYAYGHSQLNEDERRMLRDYLAWITAPNQEIPEVKPGQSIALNVPITAATTLATAPTKIRLLLRDPDARLIETKEYESSLIPGQTVEIPYLFDSAGKVGADEKGLGIWSLNYELVVGEEVVQVERLAMRAAISKQLQGTPPTLLAATASMPTSIPYLNPIPIQLSITNNDQRERTISYTIQGGVSRSHFITGSVTVKAGSTMIVEKTGKALWICTNPDNPIWVMITFRDESGRLFSREYRQVYAYESAAKAEVEYSIANLTRPGYGTDAHPAAQTGDRMRVTATITDKYPRAEPSHWHFMCKGYYGGVVYQEDFEYEAGSNTFTKVFEFTVPRWDDERFHLSLTGEKGGESLSIKAVSPEFFDHHKANYEFTLLGMAADGWIRLGCKQKGPGTVGGKVAYYLNEYNPAGYLGEIDIPDMAPGGSCELSIKVDPGICFDTAQANFLRFTFFGSAGGNLGHLALPRLALRVSLSDWNGRAGDMLKIKAGLTGGPLSSVVAADLRLRIPDLSFTQDLSCMISPENNTVDQVFSVAVPASMGPGVYPVILEAVQGDRVLYSVGTMMKIKNAEIQAAFLGPDPVRAGETVSWRLVNVGGSATTAEFRIAITTIGSPLTMQELELPLDTPEVVSVQMPADLTSGIYRLSWEIRDKRLDSTRVSGHNNVVVQGPTASVLASTDKDYYLAGDPVGIQVVTKAGSLPVAGKLHIEVRHAVEGGYDAAWPTWGGGLARQDWIQGVLGLDKPGYRWKSSHGMLTPRVGKVLPGTGRQVVALESDYDGWNLSVVVRDAANGDVIKIIEPKSFVPTAWYNLPIMPEDLSLIDLDGDGVEEIVFYVTYLDSSLRSNTCVIALSAQDGTRWTNLLSQTPGYNPTVELGLGSGDYDGDGKIEVFAVSKDHYYLLDGDSGQIQRSLPAPIVLSGSVPRVAQDDLNLDGRPELVLCAPNYCVCLAGDLSLLWATALPGQSQYWYDVAMTDLEGDGSIEVVASVNGGLVVLAGATGQIRWERTFGENLCLRSLAVGDINRDGRMEIIAASYSCVRTLTCEGEILWSSTWGGGPVSLITQPGRSFILVDSGSSLDCRDAAAGELVWSYTTAYYSYHETAIADVDGDGQLELLSCHGCLDAYEPVGTAAPVQDTAAGTYSEIFMYAGRPWVAADGSLWQRTEGGLSYYDPLSGNFGSIPFVPGEEYVLANTDEGLTILTWGGVLGHVDLGTKTLVEEWCDDPGIAAMMNEFYYHNDGWFKWMDADYLWYDGGFWMDERVDYPDLQGEGGILGVASDGTAFALINGEIWGWNFDAGTLTGPFPSPVTTAVGCPGGVQLTVESAYVPIYTNEHGLALCRFDPATKALSVRLTEDELKAAFASAAGSQPVQLSMSLIANGNNVLYVCLSDSGGLPYLFTYDGSENRLVQAGAFVGQGVTALHTRVDLDGNILRLVPSAQPRIEKLIPAGGRMLFDLPREVSALLAAGDNGSCLLSPTGEYCIFLGGVLYCLSPSGALRTVDLAAAQDWDIIEMAIGRDPDLLYLYVRLNNDDPNALNRYWLKTYRISTGEVSDLAYLGHQHFSDFVMYEYYVPGLLVDNDVSYFNRSESLSDLDREQLALWVYEPGMGEKMIGYWSGVYVWSDKLMLLCKKGNLVYLLDADYTLWAMDLTTGRSWLAGQMDHDVGSIVGVYHNPTDDLIYFYDFDATMWTWDFLLHEPTGSAGGTGAGAISEEVVWSADYRLELAEGAGDTRTASLDNLPPGQYRLEAALRTDRGQLVGRSQDDFVIARDNLLGLVKIPAAPVKVNTTVPLTASVANLSTVIGQDVEVVLLLLPEGREARDLQRVTFHLAPGESREIEASALLDQPGDALVRLELRRDGSLIGTWQSKLTAAAPQVEVTLESPAEAGRAPFAVRAMVKNTGQVAADLTVTSELLGLSGQPVALAPGEEKLFEREIAINGDALFSLSIQGDCTLEKTAAITMAESIRITPEVLEVYPDGLVAPDVILENTGTLPTSFQAELTLTGAGQVVNSIDLDINLAAGASDSLALPCDLQPGSYVFSWHTPLGSGEVAFEVKQSYAATLSASCRENGASLAVDLNLVNLGFLSFTGYVKAVVGGEPAWHEVSLAPGLAIAVTVELPLPFEAGTYPVEVTLEVNGAILAAARASYTRQITVNPAADIKLVSVPQDLVLTTGEERSVGIRLRNDGLQAGEVSAVLDCGDQIQDGQVVTVAPGEEAAVQFSLAVPEDRESGVYTARIFLDDREAASFEYSVQGLKLQVTATTDKETYTKGETVALTLQVAAVDGGENLPLKAAVKFGEFEETRFLTLNGQATLIFSIPVEHFGQKLFYGFYHAETERSLYLDTLYIYEDHELASITTDKQIYQAGETINVYIVPHRNDWCIIEGPGGFQQSILLEGPVELAIPLGSYTPRGTYTIRAVFSGDVIEYYIDVRGPYLELQAHQIDKDDYLPGETLNASLTYASDMDISCRLAAEAVTPDGSAFPLGTTNVSFTAGRENHINLALPLGNLMPGIERLYLRLYAPDETLIHTALIFFKLGRIELERIDLSMGDYPEPGMPVPGTLALRGEGTGTVAISLDGEVVQTIPVTLTGGTTLTPFAIPADAIHGPGRHLVEVVLAVGGETTAGKDWFNYGTDLPDLVIYDVEVGKELVDEKYYQVKVCIAKTRRLPVAEAEVRLSVHSDLGERLIGSITTAPLSEGPGFTSVEFLWDATDEGGTIVLMAEVNPERVIEEFDITNNTYEVQCTIPSRPEARAMPEICSHRVLEVTGTADPWAVVFFSANGVTIGGGQADATGVFSVEIWLEEGVNSLACWEVNAESRMSLSRELGTIIVDTIPPAIRIEGFSDSGIVNHDVTVSVQIDETNPSSVRMTLDGVQFDGTLAVTGEGSHALLIEAVDAAGHTAGETLFFVIDKTAPAIMVSGLEADHWYPGDVMPSVDAVDITLVQYQILLDGQEYDGAMIGKEGPHQLTITAVDAAGNASQTAIGFGIDKTPPLTAVVLQGIKGSDGWYKSDVTVSLTASDNTNGAGIETIYYQLGASSAPIPYTAPFTIGVEGRTELIFYAVDKAGNQEAAQVIEVMIARIWSPAYTFLCEELEGNGNVKVDTVFSNGAVYLNGNCVFGQLGSTQGSITKRGNVKINQLFLNAPYERLPVPDWNGLASVTALRHEKSLTGNLVLADVRFAGDLSITGNVRISGLLVVEGDLTISGNLNFDQVGIFCRGKITITGNAKLKGLVYAGNGLAMHGHPSLTGCIVINGLASICGNIGGGYADMDQFIVWLREDQDA